MAEQATPPLDPVVVIMADDSVYAENLGDALKLRGINVLHLSINDFNPSDARALNRADVVVVETHTLVHRGTDLLEAIRTADPLVEVIAISSRPVVRESVCALRTGVFAVLEYPVDSAQLVRTVSAACQRKRRAATRIDKLEHDKQWPMGPNRRRR